MGFQGKHIPALPFLHVPLSAEIPSHRIKNPQTVGEHLKNRRQALHLLQKDVAKILNVSEDTITYWENNRSKPQIAHYPKIIAFLGYDPLPSEANTLGERIKKFRHEQGISQEKLAGLIGMDESSVWSWEVGKHVPISRKLKLLEKILHQKELSF